MITRIVKLTFKQEHVDDFLKVFNNSKEKIRSFEGCNHLELLQDINSVNVFPLGNNFLIFVHKNRAINDIYFY